MADITKRAGDCDDECGEGGERGERGKRGHRGPPGPPGPSGTTTLIILGSDPDTIIIAGVNGGPGSPIYVDPGTAFLAANDTRVHAQVLGLLGPAGMTAGQVVPAVYLAGALVLTSEQWDARTGGSGGLVSGAVYYVDSTAGKLTLTRPTDDDAFTAKVGTAISNVAMAVDLGVIDAINEPPPPGSGYVDFSAGLQMLDAMNEGQPQLVPYAPGKTLQVDNPAGPASASWDIGFGSTHTSSDASSNEDVMCWAAPFAATLTRVQVNVQNLFNASFDVAIRLAPAAGGPFGDVLTINGMTTLGNHSTTGTVGVVEGDRVLFQVTVNKLT